MFSILKKKMMEVRGSINSNNEGFTLVEMVIAVAVLSLIMPVVVSLTTTALNAKEVSGVITGNLLAYSGFDEIIRNDIAEADFISTSDFPESQILLMEVDGKCKVWRISIDEPRVLKYSHDAPNAFSGEWTTFYEKVMVGSYFNYDGRVLRYNLNFGEGNNVTNFNGEASAKTFGSPTGVCDVHSHAYEY